MAAHQDAGRPLFLLDGMSLAFRAYFALPPDLATKDGRVTNALHGFVSMLVNLVRDHRPSAMAVAFDLPGGTFRDELVTGYKAGRADTPDDLLPQFAMVREVLAALAIAMVETPGYEADDVLATLATEARDRACPVVVVTGDRDCFQLVEDPYVRVLYNRRGVSDYTLYDEAGIEARTGVDPARYPMLAALRGDPSDNLPGVPGVGEKTAARLLQRYGDLDGIFANVAALTPKLRQNLVEHQAMAMANARVIPLVRDVAVAAGVDDLALGGWDASEIEAVFTRYELRTLWDRMRPLLEAGTFGPPRTGAVPKSAAAEVGEVHDESNVTIAAGPPVSLVRPVDPASAAAALAALGAPGATIPGIGISIAARWDGIPGRTAVAGLATHSRDSCVWIDGALLESSDVRWALQGLLDRVDVTGHQVKELLRSLLEVGIDCVTLVMDVAVAAYLLDPSAGDYTLDAILGWLLKEPVATGQLPLGGAGEDESVPVVAAAAMAARLVEPLRRLLYVEGLVELHDEVESPLVRVLARMELTGIGVDTAELRRISDELEADVVSLAAQIHELVGHEFNLNSTPQLRAVLYGELGLTPGRKTKTGYSTDAATLETLRNDHPVVDALLRYREVEKLRSTYAESLLSEVGPDGRIHASFRQTVARTGRLSSERPNLHNIPVRTEGGRRFRRAFVPCPGWSFLVADYDQIELRVIAHLSGDPGLVAAFTSGEDVHRAVAAGVFGVSPKEVTKAQRERAKMVSYGLAYGMEAFGLSRRLGTGVEEANDIMDRYFSAFPEVRNYMERTVAEARARGYTRTERGRKRPLPELSDRNYRIRLAAERQAMNAGTQGLAADLFKTALVRLDGSLESGGLASRLVLQIHDEVIVEVSPGEEDEVALLTAAALTSAMDLSVPLHVTMAFGDSWAGAKDG